MCRLLAMLLLLLPAAGFAQEPKGKNYAFLVACGRKYNKAQLHPLPKSFRDMDDFRKALLKTGFDDSGIVFMHDDAPNPLRFLPERDKILRELKQLVGNAGPEDTVVVALNGHGLHFKGDKTSYFCPLNAVVADRKTLIPMDGPDGIFPILKGCKAKRKLLVVGACRNDPAKTSQAAEKVDLDLTDPDEVPEGIVALYSCRAGQKTYFEGRQPRSFFFDNLVRAWEGEFHPGQDKIPLESVFDVVKDKTSVAVRKLYGEAQVPEVRREYRGEWMVSLGKVAAVTVPKTPPVNPKPGEEWEFEIAKGVKMRFCWVPPGEAQLGSSKEEQENLTKSNNGKRLAYLDVETESWRGNFKTKGFWLGKYEVTQKEYEGVTGSNPSTIKGPWLPVEQVSWEDCQKFIAKCGVKGMKLKLPHEDEWEYACRGGKGNKQPFYWGDALNGDKANTDGTDPYGTTTPGASKAKSTVVGSYEKVAPHPWGLCDMHGNVWEWCDNSFNTANQSKLMRGGSWFVRTRLCLVSHRAHRMQTYRSNDVGFRLALVP